MIFDQRGYVLANSQYISTVTGRRWPATPENLEALLKDNALVTGANANRPPAQSTSTTWKIAASAAEANPLGPNVWHNAIAIHRAMLKQNNFQPDSRREEEIERMEQEAKAFDARKSKLTELQPANPEPEKSVARSAAESLRKNPGQLDPRLAKKIADRLDTKSDADEVAAEIAAKEAERRSAPEFVNALKLQSLEVSLYERTAVPADMLANAKKLLAALENGSVDAPSFWGVWEPEQSATKYAYLDGLAASKKNEIAKLRSDLQIIDEEPEPPAPVTP